MNNNIKGILLLGDENSIIQQLGSKPNIVTSKDSLLIKTYKTFANEGISSGMKSTLSVENPKVINWVIVFKEAIVNVEDVLIFCKENNFNLLLLKKELELNEQYDFKIIHSPNLKTASKIYETIISKKEEESMQ